MQIWHRHTQHALAALVVICGLMVAWAPETGAQTQAPTTPQTTQPPPVDTAPQPSVPTGAAQNLPNGQPSSANQPAAAPTAPAGTAGPPLAPQDLLRRLDAVVPELDRLGKAVERVRDSDDELERQRAETETLRGRIATLRQDFAAPLQALSEQLRKIGPRPVPPAPAETSAIAAERARIDKAVSEVDAAIKTLDLTDERARQLIGRIQSFRNELISRDILNRSPSPMLPAIWLEVAAELPRAAHQVTTILGGWSELLAARPWLTGILFLVAALAQINLMLVQRGRIKRLMPEPPAPEPSSVRRLTTATAAATLTVLPSAAAAVILYGGVRLFGLDNQFVAPLLDAALLAFAIYAVTRLIALAVLTPDHPSWRAIAITSPAASRLVLLITLIGAVLGLDVLLDSFVRILYLPPAVGIVKTHLATTAIAGLIGAIALTGLPPAAGNGDARRMVAAIANGLKVPLLLLAVGLVAASVVGYVGLARFVSRQTLALLTGGVAILLIHTVLRAVLGGSGRLAVAESGGPLTQAGASLLGRVRQGSLASVLRYLLTGMAALVLSALILLSWGFSIGDLAGWGRALLFGFKVGDYTISLWKVIVAVMLFAGLLVLTRLFQRWLSASVLVPPRMDAGIAHSIETGVGYVGTILAALVGLSHAGLDVSHLAIVAGALSVGIGFGLQSIANNFVSGLILLVERPIKVGDWIIVGEHQGHVRRISVRATEIETFDRASVIVPNSQLITGSVQNWTLRNSMGRLTIKLSASYDADPEHVMATVRAAIETCPSVLIYPAPRVTFTDFGASSLDFTVHAFIADVSKGLDAQNEIRIAVFKAFKAAGIEIPFPQTDIHLRDLEALRLLTRRTNEDRGSVAATTAG